MKFKLFSSVFIILLTPFVLFSQTTTRFFIERNFGLDIDTNEFFVCTVSKDLHLDIFNYEIGYQVNDSMFIYIEPEVAKEFNGTSNRCSDDFVFNLMSTVNEKIREGNYAYWVGDIHNYNRFYYYFMKGGRSNLLNDTSLSLWSYKCFGSCELLNINCFSEWNSYVSSEDFEKVFKKFINGLTYYTDEELMRADSILCEGIEPRIEITDKTNWKGVTWIENNKNIEIIDVNFEDKSNTNSHRIFYPDKRGKIVFSFEYFNNIAPFTSTGKGFFRLKNPLGKVTRLYFDFSKEFNR